MKRHMFATASATILSLGLLAATPVMSQGVSQLQESVTNSIAQLGVSTENVGMLTLQQLQEIELTLNGSDSDDVKRKQVELIMAESPMAGDAAMSTEAMATETQSTGMRSLADASGLQDAVKADIANLGIDEEIDVDMLTVGQLSQITLTMNNTDSEDAKRNQVRQILGIE